MRCSDVIRLVFFLMTPLQIHGDEKRGSPQGGTGNAKPKHDIRSVSGLRRIRRFCVLRLVDKASAGGVFYFYSHSIFTDFKEIVFVIFDVAVRSSFLIEEIASVRKPLQAVNALLDFLHCTVQSVDVGIKGSVPIYILINLEYSA